MLSLRSLFVWSILAVFIFCFPTGLKSQVTEIDTSEYIPFFYDDYLEYNLMIASAKGYPFEIEKLLKKGADINASTNEGATPLVLAVSNRHADAVRTLLSFGPEINIRTLNSETPLLIAVKTLNPEIAEELIRAGADIDQADRSGASPLHYAAAYGSYQIADLLIYYFASADNKSNDGTTPLMAAIWSGAADIAGLLIRSGANLEARDNEGFTPLLIAAQNGDTLIMSMLLQNGVDIYEKNIFNYDALDIAIRSDKVLAVDFLLKKGQKWMKEGNDAINPYEVARKYDHNGLYNLLKSNSVTGTTGHRIDQMAVTLTTRFSTDDFYSGISLAFREPLLNAGIIAGCETKLWYSKIMIEYDENIIYQYKEKRSLVYAGLFKDFTFLRNDRGSSFSVYASLFAGLSFGNKLKGTYFSPGEKIHIIPEAGAKWTRDNLSLFAGADFLKSNYYSYSPLWIRFGCSYNLFFDRIKAPGKTIKWY